MNKKYAVITINIGDKFNKMASMTTPTHKAYAKRIGADFVEINSIDLPLKGVEYLAYWAKFQIYCYLKNYDRIIYLDLDTIVRDSCPNLFEVVPPECFGALYETDYGLDHFKEIEDFTSRVDPIKWDGSYFNVGVMVASKQHRDVFKLDEKPEGGKNYPEQTLINYNTLKLGVKTFHLDCNYNFMWFLDMDINKRLDSYIMHYAAVPQDLRDVLIEDDLNRISSGEGLLLQEEIESLFSNSVNGWTPENHVYNLQKNIDIGID